jgi:hypothetical protein
MDETLRRKIEALLDAHRIMTIATLRPDGWPQATTVGYVNEGLVLYFLCGLASQKAANLARDDRVSLTIDHDTPDIMRITGLSMAARATPVLDFAEAGRILALLPALDAINAEPGVMFANLNVGFATGNGVKRTYTAAMVQLADPNVDDEAFAKRLATKVIQVSPRLGDRDVIAVNLRYGFDLGIASGWRGHRFQFSPDMLKP